MPFNPGLGVNYPSPLKPLPSNPKVVPSEGRMQVPIEILWDVMGGAGKVIAFDASENITHPMECIAAIIVDNSECAVAVTVYFPDTSEKIIIPASAKRAAVCVYTNGMNFTVSAAGAGAGAVTRMQLLNYRIPQILIP